MPSRTVAAIELPHRCGDLAGQLALTDELLAQVRGAELAVLPECSLTGYLSPDGTCDLTPFAEPLDGRTAKAVAALAKKHRLALAAPLIEQDGAEIYNAFVVFDAAGNRLAHYRKRNPWMPEHWATPGGLANPMFEVAGLKVTISICFDVHFLADEAPRQLEEADLLLFPSAWVDEGPEDGRELLLLGLARQFEVAILNANWGVGVPRVAGQGGSRLVFPGGTAVRSAGRVLMGEVSTSGFSAPTCRDL